jgi:hypothetical protein
LTTALSELPMGDGVIPALAAVAKPNANAALNAIDLIIIFPSLFLIRLLIEPNDLSSNGGHEPRLNGTLRQ